MTERTCPVCGVTRYVEHPKAKGGGACCSRKCSGAHRRKPLLERIMSRRVITSSGCWIWETVNPNDYGRVWVGGPRKYDLVHRVVYGLLVGPIPSDRPYIDHLCRNPPCFNPEHLEPVTNRENAMRGRAPGVLLHLAGKCIRGHDYATNSKPRADGKYRGCRECNREYNRKRRAS